MNNSAHIDTFAKNRLPDPETWPDFIFGEDVPPYPDYLNAASELLGGAIQSGYGNKPSVIMGDTSWSYEELNRKSNQIAATLVEKYQLIPGNRVLLRGNNTPLLAALWYGVIKAGGIVITTMTMLRQKELDAIIEVGKPDIIIIEEGLSIDVIETCSEKARHVVLYGEIERCMKDKDEKFEAVSTASDDIALLAFTSGTTGLPKATMHFHRDILAMADSFARHVLKPEPDDVFCGSPPLAFTFGLGGLLVFPARFGASVVYFEGGGPDVLLNMVERHRVTTLFTAPTAYKAIIEHLDGRDISSLKKCISAGFKQFL